MQTNQTAILYALSIFYSLPHASSEHMSSVCNENCTSMETSTETPSERMITFNNFVSDRRTKHQNLTALQEQTESGVPSLFFSLLPNLCNSTLNQYLVDCYRRFDFISISISFALIVNQPIWDVHVQ